MRRAIMRCGLLVGAICLAGTWARADEIVRFDSARYRVGDLQQRLARERGETPKPARVAAVQAYLSRPEGNGPFPAVVYLHGCGGLSAYARKSAATQMTGWGYVSLVVDSFATRGVKNTCTTTLPDYRKADAFGALLYLSKLPFVDAKRIALVGHSQGGMAALEVASSHLFDVFEMPPGLKYRAAVAYYPRCDVAEDQLAIPTLILIGELDDWVAPKTCDWWMRRRQGKGAPVKLVVYPGAYHDFDIPSTGDGQRYFGHWLKYDAEAAASATAEMHNFLAAQLN
jgi:dienelactone hydrolase